ncbi:hypothetical protein PoB_003113200 [Plakobranchus ocellatus]|uniref:Uncharacterized protein n=1 Tax=Plakobranchus ocellatus TaxID=259542 RepID=A0AAV4ABJ7_9GAST|nr:hypothetical protein PoB_003113200 [Plakobranchus ocellatus]
MDGDAAPAMLRHPTQHPTVEEDMGTAFPGTRYMVTTFFLSFLNVAVSIQQARGTNSLNHISRETSYNHQCVEIHQIVI